MAFISAALPISAPTRIIALRELNGQDELLTDTDTRGLLLLIQRLLDLLVPESVTHAEKIIIAERDYLLALLYRHHYGDAIQSTITCRFCKEKFDLEFSLKAWVAHVRSELLFAMPDAQGFLFTEDGFQFRLPDGTDELAVWGLPAAEREKIMIARCMDENLPEEIRREIQVLMDRIAPALSREIETRCAECNQSQPVHFDMQTYFTARMKQERKRVTAEIHHIALSYKWAHAEILSLPRSLRRRYAALIGLD